MTEEQFTLVLATFLWIVLGAAYAKRTGPGFAWYKLFMSGPLVWCIFFIFLITVKADKKDNKDNKDD